MWQLPPLSPSDLSTMNEAEVLESAWCVYQARGALSSQDMVTSRGVELLLTTCVHSGTQKETQNSLKNVKKMFINIWIESPAVLS